MIDVFLRPRSRAHLRPDRPHPGRPTVSQAAVSEPPRSPAGGGDPVGAVAASAALSARLERAVFGFFTIGWRGADEGAAAWKQNTYRLSQLDAVLASLGPAPVNAYISQASFYRAERKAASVSRIATLWVDLDTYRVPALRHFTPEKLCAQVLQACADNPAMPPPSLIVDSGRGLYVKWHLLRPLPKRALPRWSLVQSRLSSLLARFGADASASDAARVLRLVGSVHGSTGRRVSVLWTHRGAPSHGGVLADEDGIVAYPFDQIADALLDFTRDELAVLRIERERERQRRQAPQEPRPPASSRLTRPNTGGLRRFDAAQLARDRCQDLRTLARLRGWTAGAPTGHRDIPTFLAAALSAWASGPEALRQLVPAYARALAPTWSEAELASCVSSVLGRADAAARGETADYRGMPADPRYRFRNSTLIAWLAISEAEQAQLRTIVGLQEVRRRGAARSRAARAKQGAAPRATYLQLAAERRRHAAGLRSEGKSWAEVGAAMGISASAARLLARRDGPARLPACVNM